MENAKNGKRGNLAMPVSGGAHSDPELKGIGTDGDKTILKVTGLRFPPPDAEVTEKPFRRKFTTAYKLRILREVDQCTEKGQVGALLRREGIYHSNLQTWRKQLKQSELNALSEQKRGRKPIPKNPLSKENIQLKRENDRLKIELKKARIIIDVQKKYQTFWESNSPRSI